MDWFLNGTDLCHERANAVIKNAFSLENPTCQCFIESLLSCGILSFWKTPLTKALLFTSYIPHIVLQFLQCCGFFSTVYPITKLFTSIRHCSRLIFCEDPTMWYTMQIVQLPYHMANLLTPHVDKIEKYSTRPVVCVVGVGTFDYGQRNFGFDFFFCRCLDLKLTNNVNFYV